MDETLLLSVQDEHVCVCDGPSMILTLNAYCINSFNSKSNQIRDKSSQNKAVIVSFVG